MASKYRHPFPWEPPNPNLTPNPPPVDLYKGLRELIEAQGFVGSSNKDSDDYRRETVGMMADQIYRHDPTVKSMDQAKQIAAESAKRVHHPQTKPK
jgi:hypothetical protein